jgi:hypothetical protein
VWYSSIVEAARVGGKTSLVEGYQILRCGEEYPGSVERGSFPRILLLNASSTFGETSGWTHKTSQVCSNGICVNKAYKAYSFQAFFGINKIFKMYPL